jgi:GntR family transcriptional regulator
MIIQIDAESDIPIYTQLTNQIIEGIARGELHPGDSLPSVRSFASDLGVNMHTVNKSYHELEKKGIIEIIPKSGAVIATEIQLSTSLQKRLISDFRPLIAEALVLGMNKEQVIELVISILQDFPQNN